MSPEIDVDKYIDEINRKRTRNGRGNARDAGGNERDESQTHEGWPQPKPLPSGLTPVE